MSLYKCEWPNGDVSFVLARDKADAMVRLDEFGAAEPRMISKLSEFMIDLSPDRKILEANERARREDREEEGFPWQLNEVGECLLDPESGVLPSEEKTLRRLRKSQREVGTQVEVQVRDSELRTRAIREGILIDLAARRRAASAKRPELTETVDEP
jgi:hypothetical protein